MCRSIAKMSTALGGQCSVKQATLGNKSLCSATGHIPDTVFGELTSTPAMAVECATTHKQPFPYILRSTRARTATSTLGFRSRLVETGAEKASHGLWWGEPTVFSRGEGQRRMPGAFHRVN